MKDFVLEGNTVLISDEVELIIQQIDMLFDTLEDEVFGEDYGSNFYDLLWDMKMSNSDVTNYTKSLIYANVKLFGWKLDVDTQFLQGTQNDIILITIKLSNYGTAFEKTYKVD